MSARSTIILTVLLLCGWPGKPDAGAADKESAGEIKLLSAEMIWDAAPHNAFTDLERFNDRWICAFREGKRHAGKGDHGKVRVISSRDGREWKSVALLESPGFDVRDAKISVMPDGRLLLNSCEYDVDNDKAEVRNNQSVVFHSEDGIKWDGPHRIADKGYWLWQTSWSEKSSTGYSLGYTWGPRNSVRLYSTKDGKEFETHVDHLRPPGDKCNEHDMVFMPDGTAHMLLRRDNSDKQSADGLLGSAKPPYRDWEWRKLGLRIGGPAMIRLPDGRLLAAVRRYDGKKDRKWGPQWTELGFIDPASAQYVPALALPSGGDNSYAGMVWHEGFLWMSYYSSHEGKTSIYFAKLEIPAAAAAAAEENARAEALEKSQALE